MSQSNFINIASNTSRWRGYEYFNEKKVISFNNALDNEISGKVLGSNEEIYDVTINLKHPKKSKCNCPFADGRLVICKHMVALYFSAFEGTAKKFYEKVLEHEREEEEFEEIVNDKVIKYVKKLKKEELQNLFFEILYDCPDWLYERFVNHYVLMDDF